MAVMRLVVGGAFLLALVGLMVAMGVTMGRLNPRARGRFIPLWVGAGVLVAILDWLLLGPSLARTVIALVSWSGAGIIAEITARRHLRQ